MTFINNLRRLAKAQPPPAELLVPSSKLGSLADHVWCGCGVTKWSVEEIREKIRQGELKIRGIPVRVIGLVFAALITLHQPDGKIVYVNPEEIQIVAPAGGVYPGRAKVLVHDQWLAVQETPEQVKFARDGD